MTTKTKKATTAPTRDAMRRLAALSLKDLRARYEAATGQPGAVLKKDFLIKTLAARTGKDAAPVASPTETAPRTQPERARDPRLPAAGTTLKREYLGKTYEVEVLERGFRFDGKEWRSLSGIAMAITKYPAISGPLFFGIAQRGPKEVEPAATAKAEAAKPPKAPRAAKAKGTPKSKKR
jgi:hypothetical protein